MAAAIPRHLLETLINCPSCLQRHTEPRVLPTCGHTICKFCLENEWKETYKHYCPMKTCRKEICSTINALTDLPLNQTVIDLIKSCNFHVEATGQCQVCNQSPSFVRCSHCHLFVCFECANQHRRDTLTTLTNNINSLEQEYLTMNDRIDNAKEKLIETREKSFEILRNYYTNLFEELRNEQENNENLIEKQLSTWNIELESNINEYKQRCQQILKSLQELRATITDWSTVEQFKQLQIELSHLKTNINDANDWFHKRLPDIKVFDINNHNMLYRKKNKINQVDSPSQTDELILDHGKHHLSILSSSIHVQHLDDSTSSASSSSNNEPIKSLTPPSNNRTIKKHSSAIESPYKSLNTLNNRIHANHSIDRQHQSSSSRPILNHCSNSLSKSISNSMADLSPKVHIRSSSFQSIIDNYNQESYKKVLLSQSYDWGILSITNTDLILIYNRDKSSLVIYDANGHENERIQWSDGEIKDLSIYHDDSIIIIGEHKQAGSKPLECKLYVCNLTRKQLERERIVERGLNCQRVTSDEKLIFYGSEKGCNKSKITVFDHDLQIQLTFESGVEIRSITVDNQSCFILGKRREKEIGRYFVEKRQKNGQLVRRIDLYELNVDNMNRLIIDPVSHGVLVTDGSNKKIWAIGSDGEKKCIQYRPWPWSIGFLTNNVLIILHAGCLTFHGVNHKKQMMNGTKMRNTITNTEKI